MSLPAFSGRKKSINLLPKDVFESSGLGVALAWALSFGKWAVIVTQLVVMGAFLWRFALDRQVTNLRKQMEQQKAVILSYSQVENDFNLAQKRVNFAKSALDNQAKLNESIQLLQALTPEDVWYDRLNIKADNISLTAYSSSLNGFSRFLSALQRRPEFTSVSVGSLEDGGSQGAQLRFDITLSRSANKK